MSKRIDEEKLKKLFLLNKKFSTIDQIIDAYKDNYNEVIEYPTMARTLKQLSIVKSEGHYQDFGVPIKYINNAEEKARFHLTLFKNVMYPEYDTILIHSERNVHELISQLEKIPVYTNNKITSVSIDDNTLMIICTKNNKKKIIEGLKDTIPINIE